MNPYPSMTFLSTRLPSVPSDSNINLDKSFSPSIDAHADTVSIDPDNMMTDSKTSTSKVQTNIETKNVETHLRYSIIASPACIPMYRYYL